MATGPTELCLLVAADCYVMLVEFLISCDITIIGTRLCAIAPGETATTRIYRADHAGFQDP